MYQFDEHSEDQVKDILNIYIRLRTALESQKYTSYTLKSVQPNYYSLSYEQRAGILKAPSTQYLCKTILMENTVYDPEYAGPFYPKHIAVIIQYITKMSTDKLQKFYKDLQNENSEKKASKSKFHFRLCEEQESFKLSGYEHNAVTPIAMNVQLPLVISKELKKLGFIWLGGGHQDVKLRIGLNELEKKQGELYYAEII